MLSMLLSQAANGLVLGFLYVLIAVGLSIIFGMLGIVNFAHGAFFAIGAYLALTLSAMLGWFGLILAPIVTGLIGMFVEFVVIRRLYDKDPLVSLIITFAMALFFEAMIRSIYGAAPQAYNVPKALSGFLVLGPVLLTKYRLFVLVVTVLALVAFWMFLNHTRFGRIIRAGSRDGEMVGLLGINLPVVFCFVFGIGCLLAGLAGMLAGPLWTVNPSMAAGAIMPAFVIVTIGGLGSFPGAVISGLLVGLTTALTIQFAPHWSGASMYLLMAAVLLVRPRGLLGERWERFE